MSQSKLHNQSEARPTAELIELALAEADQIDDGPVPFLVSLMESGTREVLDAACDLCISPEPKRRELGARILGQLGPRDPHRNRSFPEECCAALLNLVKQERNLDVLVAAIFAFGHLGNPRAEAALISRSRHRSPRVRHGVAFSLVGCCWPHFSGDAVRTLLTLMEDRGAQTRDWATTGIGAALEFDGPEIREALMRRVMLDEDAITRAEALHGLARRGDMRGLPYLIAEMSAPEFDTYLFEDAGKRFLGIDEEQNVPADALLDKLKALTQSA